MNILVPSFPQITNAWQYLIIVTGLVTTVYLIGTEQCGHYLYWKNWQKKWFSFYLILPKKEKAFVNLNSSLKTKLSSNIWIKAFFKFCILIILGISVGALSSFFWGIISFIFFGIIIYILETIQKLNQRKKIITQFPLFLQTLSNALQAGYSFEQALVFIENEVDSPLQNEIKTINQKIKLRISVATALVDFAKTINHPDINFFTESANIQLKTGGNLIELFKKISDLLEEKNELLRNIKSFTSQGKMSGILIAILWPISLVLFFFMSPQHTQTLFHTTQGQFLLGLSFCLEWFGFFFIWKIIRVKL